MSVGLAKLLEIIARRPLHQAARFVVAFAGLVLSVHLIGLAHPSKDFVDAVFQAHRLEWVLGGRYFFTQPLPDGVQFPYAIGLYVFAAPWARLVTNHVALLRVVVCASEITYIRTTTPRATT